MRSLNHLRIARLVFFLEIGGGRDSYVTGAGTNFIRVVTAAKYFALSSASHTISCEDIVKVKLKESSRESERTLQQMEPRD